jgi:hypothetical protein
LREGGKTPLSFIDEIFNSGEILNVIVPSEEIWILMFLLQNWNQFAR